jgi:hypothetical protein
MISCLSVSGKTYYSALLLFAVFPIAADSVAPEILHLARIQSKAKLGLSSIPAYTCSEVMERSVRSNSRYKLPQDG